MNVVNIVNMENAGSKGRLPGRSGGKLKVTIELSIWALKTPSHASIDLNCCRGDIFVLAFLQKIRQYGVLEGEKESQEKVEFTIYPPQKSKITKRTPVSLLNTYL